MSSAHRLTEVNIFPKCYENLSKGSGDMKGGGGGGTKGKAQTCDLLMRPWLWVCMV